MISATKASRLRKKARREKLGDSDHDALLAYEAEHPTGSQEYSERCATFEPDDDGDYIPPPDETAPHSDAVPGGPPPLRSAPAPSGKAPPPPGGKGKDADKGKRTGPREPSKWRKKYQGASMDREAICVKGADVYCAMLRWGGAKTEALGGLSLDITFLQDNGDKTNVIDDVVRPAMIAVLDNWLPDMKGTPEVIVVGSGAAQLALYARAKQKVGRDAADAEPNEPVWQPNDEGAADVES